MSALSISTGLGTDSKPKPRNVELDIVKGLERFLSFTNFYRGFIKGFSTVAVLLRDLLKGGKKGPSLAFKELKGWFVSAPILRTWRFYHNVMGTQVNYTPALSSHESCHQRRWIMTYVTVSVKTGLEEWCHWLEGALHPSTVLIDHKKLEYICQVKQLNPRQAHWALLLTRFHFIISYPPGSKKKQKLMSIQTPRTSCWSRTHHAAIHSGGTGVMGSWFGHCLWNARHTCTSGLSHWEDICSSEFTDSHNWSNAHLARLRTPQSGTHSSDPGKRKRENGSPVVVNVHYD